MKKRYFSLLMLVISSVGCAAPPGEDLIESCLRAKSVSSAVVVRNIISSDVLQEDNYIDGFDARYLVEYDGVDIGYAEGGADSALIYRGKIYRLSKSALVGDNRGVRIAAFNPMLAEWSFVKNVSQKYLCVSFNFDGLGRSGSFQNVRGGYLLNEKTKGLYFAVRSIRQ